MTVNRLFIVGFMGAGKTYIGNKIDESTNLIHYDLDFLLEKKLMLSINDIVHQYGMKKFRKLETEILFDSPEKGVITTGGGVVISAINRKFLKNELVVWLDPDWDVIYKRIKNSKRPLVQNKSEKELYELYLARLSLYNDVADIRIKENNIAEIVRLLKSPK